MIELSDPPRILIVRLGSLGDIVHAMPAMADLRDAYPEARIDWICEAPYRPLLEQTAGISEVWTADTKRWRRSLAVWHEPSRLLRQLRKQAYDVSIDFQGLWKSAVLTRAVGARQRIGLGPSLSRETGVAGFYTHPLEPDPEGLHRCQLNQELLRPLGIEPNDRIELPIQIPAEERAYVDEQLAELGVDEPLLLNPGAGWSSKLWGTERFGRLAERIERELAAPTVFTWGPGEEPLIARARQSVSSEVPIRTFPTTILQLAALCRRSRLLVAGDTGPLHLAVALGTPTVALMGPTWAWRNGSFNPADIHVRVERDCPNPYERKCPADHFCMDMTVEQVFEAVVRRLG